MATASKIGRNEPCPCGSGKKYKHCCANQKAQMSQGARILLVAIALIVVVTIAFAIRDINKSDGEAQCPAGQVWSAAHGHCH